jgi:hypothetical protein
MRVNKVTAKFKTGKCTRTDFEAGKKQVNIGLLGGDENSFGSRRAAANASCGCKLTRRRARAAKA